MSDQPVVSIVIPTFNRAHTITKSVESVLPQTYENWELLIIDDGSTDETKVVIQNFDDERIKYHFKENGGPSQARNFGVSKAQGTWIMYLDSDDKLFPNCLETMLNWLSKYPSVVFAFPRSERTLELYENGKLVNTIDDSGDTPPEFSAQGIFNREAGFSANGFTHLRRLFDEGIHWDEKLGLMEDWELMLSIGTKYPDGFLYVPVMLQKYIQRFGSDNLVSKTTYGSWADAFEYIYAKHKNDPTLKNQTWYPAKVEKWRKLQADFDAGKIPAYQYHYFQS